MRDMLDALYWVLIATLVILCLIGMTESCSEQADCEGRGG
jgi:hypothetical protein